MFWCGLRNSNIISNAEMQNGLGENGQSSIQIKKKQKNKSDETVLVKCKCIANE